MVNAGLDAAFQDNKYWFVLVKPGEKGPFEQGWNKTKKYKHDDPKLLAHIAAGGNVGILAAEGLIIVDFDDEKVEKETIPKLPPTRAVKSGGKGRLHLHYFCQDLDRAIRIDDESKSPPYRVADILGPGTQALIPPSLHPDTRRPYELVDDREPATIEAGELLAAFGPYLMKKKESKEESKIKNLPALSQVLRDYGLDLSRNPTKCLWHDSKKGKCLSWDEEKGLWFCFHCGKGGTVIDFVMEHEKIPFKQACVKLGTRLDLDEDAKNMLIQDHLTIASDFIKKQPLYYDRNLLWWGWDKTSLIWKRIDETDIFNAIDRSIMLMSSTTANQTRSSLIEAFRRKARLFEPEEPPISWIQFKDEIIDIKTDEVHKPNPKIFMRNSIPWKIGKSEDTPIMDEIIKSWVGEKHIYTIKEIMAFCAYREYAIHRVFAFNGKGRNGKSTCLNLIKRFLGPDNFVTCDFSLLLKSRFESANLWRKLACLMGEAPAETVASTGYIKTLSGQDDTRVEIKGKMPFSHQNYAKLIMSFNEIPMSDDQSLGYYSRWFILDFNNTFLKNEDILGRIPDYELENLARFSIKALKELLKRGEFFNDIPLEDRQKMYEERADSLGQFIKIHCVSDPYSEIDLNLFFVRLNEYLSKESKRPFKRIDEMSKKMRKQGYDIHRGDDPNFIGKRKQKQYLYGYRFKDNNYYIVQPVQPVQPLVTQSPIKGNEYKNTAQVAQATQDRPYVVEEIVGEGETKGDDSFKNDTKSVEKVNEKYKKYNRYLAELPDLIYKFDLGFGVSLDRVMDYYIDEGQFDEEEFMKSIVKLKKIGFILEVRPDFWKRV